MNKQFRQYRDIIARVVDEIIGEEKAIKNAATLMAGAIQKDQVIHVLGPGGHSNMAAEEVLWRAGGLACMNSILDAGTNLIHGGRRSLLIERTPGYAVSVMNAYDVGITPGEVIIIVNAYGINSMTIDAALESKKRKMSSIGVTSRSFADVVAKDHPSRHPTGKNLYQIVDIFIDNHLPYGDAVVDVDDMDQKLGPTSTFCNSLVMNLLVIETVKALKELGIEPPIFRSANLPGGDTYNQRLFERYGKKCKHLL
ncbi:MAG: sugar isomerase domain-containing protein [Spirochaetaceae bacterium]|nr:MAG: sugar isomerase domain-containing protein [Spirochaetaceae bacterium]